MNISIKSQRMTSTTGSSKYWLNKHQTKSGSPERMKENLVWEWKYLCLSRKLAPAGATRFKAHLLEERFKIIHLWSNDSAKPTRKVKKNLLYQ